MVGRTARVVSVFVVQLKDPIGATSAPPRPPTRHPELPKHFTPGTHHAVVNFVVRQGDVVLVDGVPVRGLVQAAWFEAAGGQSGAPATPARGNAWAHEAARRRSAACHFRLAWKLACRSINR
jgi:hypothetical protein